MSLLSTIRRDQVSARKSREALATALLTTLLSEASMIGLNDGKRESTDIEVISVIKKFIKGIDETLTIRPSDDLYQERAILERYLPSQLSEDELKNIVTAIVERLGGPSMKIMGPTMKLLREHYEGQYDGKLASEVVKRVLSQ